MKVEKHIAFKNSDKADWSLSVVSFEYGELVALEAPNVKLEFAAQRKE